MSELLTPHELMGIRAAATQACFPGHDLRAAKADAVKLLRHIDALAAERDVLMGNIADVQNERDTMTAERDEARRQAEANWAARNAMEEGHQTTQQMLDEFILDLAELLGLDPNNWDTDGGDVDAIEDIKDAVHARLRAG